MDFASVEHLSLLLILSAYERFGGEGIIVFQPRE